MMEEHKWYMKFSFILTSSYREGGCLDIMKADPWDTFLCWVIHLCQSTPQSVNWSLLFDFLRCLLWTFLEYGGANSYEWCGWLFDRHAGWSTEGQGNGFAGFSVTSLFWGDIGRVWFSYCFLLWGWCDVFTHNGNPCVNTNPVTLVGLVMDSKWWSLKVLFMHLDSYFPYFISKDNIVVILRVRRIKEYLPLSQRLDI